MGPLEKSIRFGENWGYKQYVLGQKPLWTFLKLVEFFRSVVGIVYGLNDQLLNLFLSSKGAQNNANRQQTLLLWVLQ